MAPNRIDVAALRSVMNRIFDFIESDLGLESVELSHNLYWSVDSDDLYEMNRDPQLNVGSLLDDLDFARAAYEDAGQAIPLVLMHIAPLLKALSTAVPSYKSPGKAGDQ